MVECLQKILANAGFGSRRQCENIIKAGCVRVNGQVAHLGQKADPERDEILVDGHPLELQDPIYIKLYKPKGVLSSTLDELNQSRPTVRSLVNIPGHLYPVGRLDKQSEGLMLLTNDGALAHRLTHPRYGHQKVYDVSLEGDIDDQALEKWRSGVTLEGRRTAPADIAIVNRNTKHTRLRITMREGRKRQIRRIAASFGYPVTKLVRRQLGTLVLGDLRPGQWKYLSDQEIVVLKNFVFPQKQGITRYKKRIDA